MIKRVFLIILDSFGIGGATDAAAFGDAGSDTLAAVRGNDNFCVPNMEKLGLFCIDGVPPVQAQPPVCGAYGRLREVSMGKDSTIGHWELAGVVSQKPLPVYPHGFPTEVLDEFSRKTGRGILCNRPYSGTEVIKAYGEEHLRTGNYIVYTSADSVFQIAAHEDKVPLETLYHDCKIAREMLQGEHGVGRVIARPFTGTCAADFTRTANRHDFSLQPPARTMLDAIKDAGKSCISVGKIYDIFAGRGITEAHPTHNNEEGMEQTLALAQKDFEGLVFVNLVDFDMVYGHRNDVAGYAAALTRFDDKLGRLLPLLRKDDLLLITADHGCDPATPSTDHSREDIPLLMVGGGMGNLGTQTGFYRVADTVCDALGVDFGTPKNSFLRQL